MNSKGSGSTRRNVSRKKLQRGAGDAIARVTAKTSRRHTSLFPPGLRGSSGIKSRCPSKSDSPGIPRPSLRPPGREASHGAENLPSSARTSLVSLFSSMRVAHLEGTGCDFNAIAPLWPSRCGFSFVLGRGVSFFRCVPASSC